MGDLQQDLGMYPSKQRFFVLSASSLIRSRNSPIQIRQCELDFKRFKLLILETEPLWSKRKVVYKCMI